MKTIQRRPRARKFPAAVRPRKQALSIAPVWSVSPGSTSYYINSVAACADGSGVIAGTFLNNY
jgi:hypothetical protein